MISNISITLLVIICMIFITKAVEVDDNNVTVKIGEKLYMLNRNSNIGYHTRSIIQTA